MRVAECSTRRGFTLVEIVVALSIGAMVVLGARMLVETLSSQALQVSASARAADADANGDRVFRALVGRLEAADSNAVFGGDAREARFSSWCQIPRGWLERCSVQLRMESGADSSVLRVLLSTGERLVVKSGDRGEGLRYLVDPTGGGRWVAVWVDGRAVPWAIGVLIGGDTLIVRVGERG